MPLQTQNLVMVGLGLYGDAPPSPLQPPLADGIHLRWAFPRTKGFPWHGYYLYRRPYHEGDLIRIGPGLEQFGPGEWPSPLVTPFGQFTSDQAITLADGFDPKGQFEADLGKREHLRFTFRPGDPARKVEVLVGFDSGAEVTITALFGEHTVARTQVGGKAGEIVGATLESDAITAIQFSSAPAALVDMAYVPVTQDLTRGWELVPDFTYPLSLPITHPDYPCSHGAGEELTVARKQAYNRIRYGDPDRYVPSPKLVHEQGTVHVAPGSPVVMGDATGWDGRLAGNLFLVQGDPIAYTIIAVIAPDRLVLSRPYGGFKQYYAPYEIAEDSFGELHDTLAQLLQGGPAAGPMAARTLPAPVHQAGTIELVEGKAYVRGTGTGWDESLTGLVLTVEGEPTGYVIDNVGSDVELKLDRPYTGPSAAGLSYTIGCRLAPPSGGGAVPLMPEQSPLDLVLLDALNPAVAQMLGLYWVDQTAQVDEAYDYLLLANGNPKLEDPYELLYWALESGFQSIDGFIVFNEQMEKAPLLEAPTDLKAYALPGGVLATGVDATNNAGLRWNLGESAPGILLPGSAILYHLWRVDLGLAEPKYAPPEGDYRPLTEERPLLVTDFQLPAGQEPARPGDWPPFPLHAIDRGLQDGWYSYRVNGIDLFGRHSPLSLPSQWRQWADHPEPRPWYYVEPPVETGLNDYGVSLLDKAAPPPPTAVEAFALDPGDPTVVRDAAYQAWYGSLSPAEQGVIGLRVRWQWTHAHMLTAPDTREFRIYCHPGPMNALLGNTVTVSPYDAEHSAVDLDIADTHAAGAYAGAYLRLGNDAFRIVWSEGGSPLRVRVAHIGAGNDIAPRAKAPCSVVIPEGHPLATDFRRAPNWEARLFVVDFNDHVTITADEDGLPLRQYELFLPAAGDPDRNGLPLAVSLAEPVAYAYIGITAVDDKQHTDDDPQRSGRWGARKGNESRPAGPAKVFRVRRTPPPAPAAPPADGEKVYATAADYHGRSYFTYRWTPTPHLKSHIFRALDDAVFQADWAKRPRPALAASDTQYFPNPAIEPRWDLLKRQQVANDLNHLNTFSKTAQGKRDAWKCYRSLPNDALRVLAGLPGNEAAFTQITNLPLDPDDPINADRRGPDSDPGYVPQADLRAYLDGLDGRTSNRYFYRSGYVDGAQNRGPLSLATPPVYMPNVVPPRTPSVTRVLGGDRAITVRWASNREADLKAYRVYRAESEAAARDLRLMTLVHTEPVGAGEPEDRPAEVAWTDTPVPGLTTLYYRVAALDEADNLSLPSPVVEGRAYDDSRPEPPAWNPTAPGAAVGSLLLSWTSPDAGLACLVQRSPAGANQWSGASGWLPRGTYTFTDEGRDPGTAYDYRLRVMDSRGRQNSSFNILPNE